MQEKCHKISASAKYSPIEEPRISPPSLPSQPAKDQTSTAEKDVRPKVKNMNRFPLLTENSTKQAPGDSNKTMDLPLKSEHKPWITSPVEDEADYDILRRCFQCGILLPLPTLNQHQVPSLYSLLRKIQVLQCSQILPMKRPFTLSLLCVPKFTLSWYLPPGVFAQSPRDWATFEGRARSFICVSPVPGPGAEHSKSSKTVVELNE